VCIKSDCSPGAISSRETIGMYLGLGDVRVRDKHLSIH
jgi:hypothetical protein